MGNLQLRDVVVQNNDKKLEDSIKQNFEKIIFGCIVFDKKIKKLEKIDKDAGQQFTVMVILFFANELLKTIEIGEILKKKHRFIHINLLLAQCYIMLGLLENADNCFKQAYEIKPQSKTVLICLYKQCMQKKDFQNGINYLNDLKLLKPHSELDYLIGLTYQQMNEHEKAIQSFEIAHKNIQRTKYFIAKMESYQALGKYEEAFECCMIATIFEPGNQQLQEILKKYMELLGIEGEQKSLMLKLQQDYNYTLSTYKEKKELEAEQTKLIMRQSKIRVKPQQSQIAQTQSQIKLNKQNQQITYYLDAIYYTFTYFFTLYINNYQDSTIQISKYLSTNQNVELLNLTDMIRKTIQKCYPDLQDFNTDLISDRLIQWYNKKFKENQDDIFKHLYQNFYNLNQTNLKQKLIERLNEDFNQSVERKNKNTDFYLYLAEISREVEKQGYTIYKESGGQLGLEHAIIILGFMIKFIELVDDNDSFENLIFRGLDKEDFQQYFQSQSRIKQQNQVPNQKQQLMQEGYNFDSDSTFLSKFL